MEGGRGKEKKREEWSGFGGEKNPSTVESSSDISKGYVTCCASRFCKGEIKAPAVRLPSPSPATLPHPVGLARSNVGGRSGVDLLGHFWSLLSSPPS